MKELLFLIESYNQENYLDLSTFELMQLVDNTLDCVICNNKEFRRTIFMLYCLFADNNIKDNRESYRLDFFEQNSFKSKKND